MGQPAVRALHALNLDPDLSDHLMVVNGMREMDTPPPPQTVTTTDQGWQGSGYPGFGEWPMEDRCVAVRVVVTHECHIHPSPPTIRLCRIPRLSSLRPQHHSPRTNTRAAKKLSKIVHNRF
jgi:hypothetical protein